MSYILKLSWKCIEAFLAAIMSWSILRKSGWRGINPLLYNEGIKAQFVVITTLWNTLGVQLKQMITKTCKIA